jgi:hypothetical protein
VRISMLPLKSLGAVAALSCVLYSGSAHAETECGAGIISTISYVEWLEDDKAQAIKVLLDTNGVPQKPNSNQRNGMTIRVRGGDLDAFMSLLIGAQQSNLPVSLSFRGGAKDPCVADLEHTILKTCISASSC